MDIKTGSLVVLLMSMILLLPLTVASIEKPPNYNPIYTLAHKDISILYSGNIEGTYCTNRYKTSGDYCSGNIKLYYQCDYGTDGGLTWQKKAENCGNYGYLCVGGECVPSSTHNILMQNIKQVLIFLGIIGFFGILYWRDKKK